MFIHQPLVKFKSHLYYEEKDQVPEALKALKPLQGSKIIFYKNGINQGEAFIDINKGAYYPTVSIHKSATVSVNFGPNFKCPPTDVTFRGVSNDLIKKISQYILSTIIYILQMHDRAEEAIAEQSMADILYFTENEGKLRLDTFAL